MRPWRLVRGGGLPVLRKELCEEAERKRTYLFRVFFAIVLFGYFFSVYSLAARELDVFMRLGRAPPSPSLSRASPPARPAPSSICSAPGLC